MVKADDYNILSYFGKNISLTMKNGKVEKDIFLGIDYYDDNDEGDGFILAVNGDRTIGRLVLEKDVERVEFED
ncbi:hypothetical protein HMPREF2758_05295 [Facklamia sp. HMSC062C11]|uniref:Uncharacterized protein n=1 Tax=Facklamia hominis TaxID=178214 RepID=A0AAJ1V212_9LACT|nr:hypothetical protein [Facklamia sp. HMSC062C11]MDK7187070.1 hypothetical protein [Facklamia hominis]OFL63619.1 hypothetical protein HMPREF2758_05295 [Facklamia sp. HMSC062C11]